MMPFIERLYLAVQPVTDIEPLSNLKRLRLLELDAIPVADLSPLEGLDGLEYVSLTFGTFSSLSPLASLPNLARLEIFGCPNINIRNLPDFRFLRELTLLHPEYDKNHYKYLPGIPLELLKIEESEINSFEWFSPYKSSLRTLSIRGTQFTSLNGIEEFKKLQTIIMGQMNITDFTPLLSLPELKQVWVTESMLADAEEIRDRAEFEIVVY